MNQRILKIKKTRNFRRNPNQKARKTRGSHRLNNNRINFIQLIFIYPNPNKTKEFDMSSFFFDQNAKYIVTF